MPDTPPSPQDRDTDPGWVRARTQAEIDHELAAWADAPLWTGGLEEAGPPTQPMRAQDAALPAASPPEPPPAVDYSWLYRDPNRPVQPPLNSVMADVPRQTWAPVQPTSPAMVPPVRELAQEQSVDPHRRRRVVLTSVLALALCLSLGAGAAMVAVGVIGPGADEASTPPDGAPATPVAGQVWDGALTPIGPVTAEAECVAKSAKDGAGAKVSYAAGNAIDGDPGTAWRCDRSDDVAITFTVPADQQIASVGLINGYAKVDPSDGSKRYGEYRRILQATWTLPDGSTVDQQLIDGEEGMQDIRVPVSSGGTITLTITRVTNPGSASATRDAVLVSDVAINGPQG